MFNADLFHKVAEGKWLLIGIVTCVVISLLVLRAIIYQAKTRRDLSPRKMMGYDLKALIAQNKNSGF